MAWLLDNSSFVQTSWTDEQLSQLALGVRPTNERAKNLNRSLYLHFPLPLSPLPSSLHSHLLFFFFFFLLFFLFFSYAILPPVSPSCSRPFVHSHRPRIAPHAQIFHLVDRFPCSPPHRPTPTTFPPVTHRTTRNRRSAERSATHTRIYARSRNEKFVHFEGMDGSRSYHWTDAAASILPLEFNGRNEGMEEEETGEEREKERKEAREAQTRCWPAKVYAPFEGCEERGKRRRRKRRKRRRRRRSALYRTENARTGFGPPLDRYSRLR